VEREPQLERAAAASTERRLTRPDGRVVAFVEGGEPDGLPVLEIPGTPGSRRMVRHDGLWSELGVRMIITERPGFGASTRLSGRSFVEPVDDIVAVLDELRLDRVPVYAFSGGAPYALTLAARYPERVRAVSIASGAAPVTDEEASTEIGLNAAGDRIAKSGNRKAMVALLSPVRKELLADPLAGFRSIMANAPPGDQAIMADPRWQATFRAGMREALRPGVEGWVDESMLLFAGWRDLDPGSIRTSVAWWHGENDRNVPISAVRRFTASLPDARLAVWDDAGHLTRYRREREVLEELLARSAVTDSG
jgi:pimeloyl-ACP methyl ester carboxylesterase